MPSAAQCYKTALMQMDMAVKADKDKQPNVVDSYQKAVEYFEKGTGSDANEDRKKDMVKKQELCKKRLEFLKKNGLGDKEGGEVAQAVAAVGGVASGGGGVGEKIGNTKGTADKNTPVLPEGDICVPTSTLDDVVGLEDIKMDIRIAVEFPGRFPQCFPEDGARFPTNTILFYGPPGTGKTMIGRAAAGTCQCPFWYLSCAEIVSPLVGASEKTLKGIFEKARNMDKTCILFFDEIDSMVMDRDGGGGNDGGSSHRLVNTFLTELSKLDVVSKDLPFDKRCVVMAASNLFESLDPAFKRRMEHQIKVPLPDAAARREMLERAVEKTLLDPEDEPDVDELLQLTQGKSGSDIARAVKLAQNLPLKEYAMSTRFRLHPVTKLWQPAESDDEEEGGEEGAFRGCTLYELPPEQISPAPVGHRHFASALSSF